MSSIDRLLTSSSLSASPSARKAGAFLSAEFSGDIMSLCGLRGRFALRHRHFTLAKQRHDLLRVKLLLRHDPSSFPNYSLTTLGSKKPGQSLKYSSLEPGGEWEIAHNR